jgi:membrane protein DedA with SNARE-associated domain
MNLDNLTQEFFNWILSYPSDTIFFVIVGVLFIASVLESLPFTGMFFPSESLTIFFGILAFKGVVNINILIIVAYIGILVGDIIGYYIGKKVGEDFLRKHSKKLKIDEKKYNKMKQFLDNNLFKALFIGRSNGFTRWITPFLAGANGIKIDKFILVNMLTAAFWAPVFLLGGYYLGEAFEVYGKYFGITIIIITIIVFIFYKFYKYFDKKGYLKRNDIKLFLINIFGLYLFLKMLEDVLDLEKITKIDVWIHIYIVKLYTPFLNKVMIFITSFNNPLEVTIISILIFLFLTFKKFYYKALFFLVSIIGASLLVEIIKNIVKRIRPEHYLIEVSGYSFPSGHATLSTALAFSLYFILKDKLNKKVLLLLCLIYPILISFSRVYLNVHYLSDVIAGIGLGLFWVSFLIILVFEK